MHRKKHRKKRFSANLLRASVSTTHLSYFDSVKLGRRDEKTDTARIFKEFHERFPWRAPDEDGPAATQPRERNNQDRVGTVNRVCSFPAFVTVRAFISYRLIFYLQRITRWLAYSMRRRRGT